MAFHIIAGHHPHVVRITSCLILLLVSASADSVFEAVCSGPTSILEVSCDQTIQVPTGFEVNEDTSCTNNWCKWDCGQWTTNFCTWNCETCTTNYCSWDCGQCTNNCCWDGRWWFGCSKSKCGETCIPCSGRSKDKCGETCINSICSGLSEQHCGRTSLPCSGFSKQHCGETCVDIPVSIDLKYTEYTLCELAGIDGFTDALETVTAFCPCMDEAIKFLSEGLVDVADSGEIGEATTAALEAAASLVDCFADNVDNVRTEKDDIIADVEDQGGLVILAPEVGLKLYAQFAGAIVLCATTGKCDDILYTMLSIFEDTVAQVGDGLLVALGEYYYDRLLDPLRSGLAQLRNATSAFESIVSDCEDDLKNTTQAVVSAFNETATKIKDRVGLVVDLVETVEATAEAVGPAIAAIEDGVEALSGSFMDHTTSFIEDGSLPDIKAAVSFLTGSEDIKTVVAGIKAIAAFVPDIDDHLQNVSSSVEELRGAAEDAIDDSEHCMSDVSEVLDTFEEAVDDFLDGIKDAVEDPLDDLELEAGIASYSSWIDVELDLPCSTMKEKTFGDESLCPGCSITAEVPVFEACPWKKAIPLPKEQTPYLRLVAL